MRKIIRELKITPEWVKARIAEAVRGLLSDAPSDGSEYVRKDAAWAVATGGGGSSDHGALTGLEDDDHTQYHTNARGDARYSLLVHTHTESQVTDLGSYLSILGDNAMQANLDMGGYSIVDVTSLFVSYLNGYDTDIFVMADMDFQGTNTIYDIADPVAGNQVGDMAFNDIRYALAAHSHAASAASISVAKAHGTSTASIQNTDVDLAWGTASITHADITIGSPGITVNADGVYEFIVYVEGTGATNRQELRVETHIDTGSGYVEDTNEGTRNYVARDSDQNTGGVTHHTMLELTDGDVVKFVAHSNADSAFTLTTETRLVVKRMS